MYVINIVAIAAPIVAINMYVETTITKATSQLPEAMEELSAMFRFNRPDAAIDYSIPKCPRQSRV